jgi:hypothetical protein
MDQVACSDNRSVNCIDIACLHCYTGRIVKGEDIMTQTDAAQKYQVVDRYNYRPQIGETLFISFRDDQPFLVTIKGFHQDKRFSSEQFEYEQCSGKKKTNTSSLDLYQFFPDAPIDSKFVYCVINMSMDNKCLVEDRHFFDAPSAFEYMEALESGVIKARADFHDPEYHVQVIKI